MCTGNVSKHGCRDVVSRAHSYAYNVCMDMCIEICVDKWVDSCVHMCVWAYMRVNVRGMCTAMYRGVSERGGHMCRYRPGHGAETYVSTPAYRHWYRSAHIHMSRGHAHGHTCTDICLDMFTYM